MNSYKKIQVIMSNFAFIILVLIIIFGVMKLNEKENKLNPRCVSLFWTGGYDSTFRLLQIVLIEKKCVNPIYLNFSGLDGLSIRRENVNFEINTMNKIINELRRLGYGDLIMPITVVKNISLSSEVLNATTELHNQGFLRRAVSQYAHMVQYSLDKNRIIEECAEKSEHSTSYKMVRPYLNSNGLLDLNQVRGTPLYVIRNIRFPIINLTKRDMLDIAKEHNFDYILQWTKSCWWPDENGKPCGKCLMCTTRQEELPPELQETFRSY